MKNYKDFLVNIKKQKYIFKKFTDKINKKRNIILRHDVDFDINYAFEMASLEKQLSIKSTYFFLVRSNFYNIFEKNNFEMLKKIKNMGHTISVHFDASLYSKNYKNGLKEEVKFFEELFDVKIKIISIHRPGAFLKTGKNLINNIKNTYHDNFFKKIKYFSDSTGEWRFGNPLSSKEFKKQESMQILIHPIWWMCKDDNNLKILENFFNLKTKLLKKDFFDNSIPFRSIINKL